MYLDDGENSRSQHKNYNKKYDYTRPTMGNPSHAQSSGKLSKFIYLEKDENNQASKVENLTTLANYYEEI